MPKLCRNDQIKVILKALYQLWKKHPKLRVGQILTILNADLNKELYDVTDKEFLTQIKIELNKCNK